MLKSQIKKISLWNKISKCDSFAIYGAGDVAECVVEVLSERNYEPVYSVVTDKRKSPQAVLDLTVYDFDEKKSEIKKEGIAILVCVMSDRHVKEIVDMLGNEGITDIMLISDYSFYLTPKTFEDVYMNGSADWYISKIEEWCFEQYGNLANILPSYTKIEANDKNKVIVVAEHMTFRFLKIAKALKSVGKEVYLFLNANKSTWSYVASEFIYPELKREKFRCILFGSVEELLYLLKKTKGKVVHIFSRSVDPFIPYIVIKLRNYIGKKIVFENYDIANGFYTNFDDGILKLEKYCIENADGFLYREYGIDPLIEKLGFNIKGKSLRFFDYCSDEMTKAEKSRSEELSLCYSGGVCTEDDCYDNPLACLMEFSYMCEKNRCHLHIYPSVWDEKRYWKYINRAKESQYFHFHKPVPCAKLAEEISKYSYGIIPIKENFLCKESSGYYTREKYIYAATNKLSDYLDAGLPIITAFPQKLSKFFEKKGVLLNWTNSDYDFEYMRKVHDSMVENVVKVHEELGISRNINRLIDFYEEL